jgi:hypothetical protein
VTPRARTAVRWLAWIGGIALGVLLITGVVLTYRYRPDATGALLACRRLHRGSAIVTGVAAAALATVYTVALLRSSARAAGVAIVAVAGVIAGFVWAARVGWRLAWDQVALWAVTTGFGYRGVLHEGPVRYVLVNGHEASPAHMRWLFWLHAAVIPAALAALLAALAVWTRRASRSEVVSST